MAGHCAPADGYRVPGIVRRGMGFVSCVVDRTAEWTVAARRPLESLHCVEGMLIAGTAAAQSGITLVGILVPGTVEQSITVLINMRIVLGFLTVDAKNVYSDTHYFLHVS